MLQIILQHKSAFLNHKNLPKLTSKIYFGFFLEKLILLEPNLHLCKMSNYVKYKSIRINEFIYMTVQSIEIKLCLKFRCSHSAQVNLRAKSGVNMYTILLLRI